MSLESDLYALIAPLCPRVYPDFAPAGTALPYVTWQQFGGPAPVFLDGSLPDRRGAWVQVSAWAATRADANALMLSIEAALCASSDLIARPQGALMAAVSEDDGIRGAMQDFQIWADR